MKDFNLSDWALGHRSLVWFLMLVCLVAGVMLWTLGSVEAAAPLGAAAFAVVLLLTGSRRHRRVGLDRG